MRGPRVAKEDDDLASIYRVSSFENQELPHDERQLDIAHEQDNYFSSKTSITVLN